MDAASLISVIVVAAVAVFTSITAPLILAHRTEKMHIEDRKAAWAHQAQMAAQIASAQSETNGRLDQLGAQAKRIHTLVNSEMTAARQAELDQTLRTLVLMRRVIILDQQAGRPPSPDDLRAIAVTEERIAELRRILAERHLQAQIIEDEARRAMAAGEVQPEDETPAEREGDPWNPDQPTNQSPEQAAELDLPPDLSGQ